MEEVEEALEEEDVEVDSEEEEVDLEEDLEEEEEDKEEENQEEEEEQEEQEQEEEEPQEEIEEEGCRQWPTGASYSSIRITTPLPPLAAESDSIASPKLMEQSSSGL